MFLNVVVFVCIIVHSLTESLSNYKISEKLIKCQLSNISTSVTPLCVVKETWKVFLI